MKWLIAKNTAWTFQLLGNNQCATRNGFYYRLKAGHRPKGWSVLEPSSWVTAGTSLIRPLSLGKSIYNLQKCYSIIGSWSLAVLSAAMLDKELGWFFFLLQIVNDHHRALALSGTHFTEQKIKDLSVWGYGNTSLKVTLVIFLLIIDQMTTYWKWSFIITIDLLRSFAVSSDLFECFQTYQPRD